MSASLCADVAKGAGVPNAIAHKVLQSMRRVVGRRLKAEGQLKIRGFAKLMLVTKRSTPQREKLVFGRKMLIESRPATKRIKMRPAKQLIDAAAS